MMSRDNSRTARRNRLFSASRTERSLIGRHSGSVSSWLCNFRSDAFESTVLVFNTVTGFIAPPHTIRDSTSLKCPSDQQGCQSDCSEGRSLRYAQCGLQGIISGKTATPWRAQIQHGNVDHHFRARAAERLFKNCSSSKAYSWSKLLTLELLFVVSHAEQHLVGRNGLRGPHCSLCSPTAETCS
jgi:hypothetical protein